MNDLGIISSAICEYFENNSENIFNLFTRLTKDDENEYSFKILFIQMIEQVYIG
jgi:hypothetical protein